MVGNEKRWGYAEFLGEGLRGFEEGNPSANRIALRHGSGSFLSA